MGRRAIRMSSRFLPILMRHGAHHYSVTRDALPEDCRIVDVGMNFRAVPGASDLILLLESDEWSEEAGIPAPEVKPLFTERRCKCESQNGSASVERSTTPISNNS